MRSTRCGYLGTSRSATFKAGFARAWLIDPPAMFQLRGLLLEVVEDPETR